jgi:arylsulfatase A-like enzyme
MNWTQEGSIHRCMLEHDKVSEAIRGYLAATSYADDMLGRIVRAVPDDAVIVIWSDHGFHLGQKFHWQKAALWETSTRVPFMIRHPGGLGAGNRIKTPVSLIDIFPTVTEIAGVPASAEVEGLSLAHMIEHPRQQRGAPAAMGFTKDNYALRAHQYRYIRYRDGEEELYDHRNDPLELENLADSVRYAELKADLATYLPPLVIKPPA